MPGTEQHESGLLPMVSVYSYCGIWRQFQFQYFSLLWFIVLFTVPPSFSPLQGRRLHSTTLNEGCCRDIWLWFYCSPGSFSLAEITLLFIIVAQLISLLYEARKDINRYVFSTSQVKKIVNFECSVYMYICITQVPRY